MMNILNCSANTDLSNIQYLITTAMFCDMLRTPLTRMKFQTCIRLTYNINQIYTLSWSMYIEIYCSLDQKQSILNWKLGKNVRKVLTKAVRKLE